ncbi:MAG: hypothetical protein M1827_005418 [Pycnora praestabilis]|nr:MAG: hypothetical protein M1827_005418 [Pycnora praestabilis]
MSPPLTLTNGPPKTSAPSSLDTEFTLSAPSDTDIYTFPSSGKHVFSAPTLHLTLPRHTFKKARVAISASWTYQYDQGGLLLVLPRASNPSPNASNASTAPQHPRWIKAGVEYVSGKAHVSVVSNEKWADWSLVALPNQEKGAKSATVEMERKGDGLVVYLIEGVQRTVIREVTWAFLEEEGCAQDCWIGAYAARPSGEGAKGELEVRFGHLVVEDGEGERLV